MKGLRKCGEGKKNKRVVVYVGVVKREENDDDDGVLLLLEIEGVDVDVVGVVGGKGFDGKTQTLWQCLGLILLG